MIEEENEDLLAELNGNAATPQEAKELAAAATNAQTDPLVVSPKRKLSAAKRAEEAMKKEAGVDNPLAGYAVTVEGAYTVAATEAPGKKLEKSYSITVNLPSLDAALSVIKNKLLDKVLRLKYPGYITFLTHEIVNVKSLSANSRPSNNVSYMDEPSLLAHIRAFDVPVSPEEYKGDLKGLRGAVVDFMLNPVGFPAREAKRLAERKEDQALERLNNIHV